MISCEVQSNSPADEMVRAELSPMLLTAKKDDQKLHGFPQIPMYLPAAGHRNRVSTAVLGGAILCQESLL